MGSMVVVLLLGCTADETAQETGPDAPTETGSGGDLSDGEGGAPGGLGEAAAEVLTAARTNWVSDAHLVYVQCRIAVPATGAVDPTGCDGVLTAASQPGVAVQCRADNGYCTEPQSSGASDGADYWIDAWSVDSAAGFAMAELDGAEGQVMVEPAAWLRTGQGEWNADADVDVPGHVADNDAVLYLRDDSGREKAWVDGVGGALWGTAAW